MASVLNSQLKIFDEAVEDNSITSVNYHPYPEENLQKGRTQTRFNVIVKDTDSWVNFSRAYLQIKAKITTSAGVAIAAENIALNGSGYCLFERAELLCDNQVIETVNHQHIGNLMLMLAGSSEDYYKTTLSNTGLALESDATFTSTGFVARKAKAAGSNMMEFTLPLKHMFGFCNTDKITRGVRYEVVLTRNSHPDMIQQDNAATGDSEVHIDLCTLWCPTVQPSIQATQYLENKLNEGAEARLQWMGRSVYRSPLFQGNDTTPTWRITNNAVKPRHVFIGFQPSANQNNNELSNQVFDHQNLTEISLKVNSETVPREKIELDYNAATKSVGRAYKLFQDYKNVFNNESDGSLVSESDWSSGLYNIYHFTLEHLDPNALYNGAADIEVRARRTGNTAGYFFCVICSEKEAVISGTSNQMRMELI